MPKLSTASLSRRQTWKSIPQVFAIAVVDRFTISTEDLRALRDVKESGCVSRHGLGVFVNVNDLADKYQLAQETGLLLEMGEAKAYALIKFLGIKDRFFLVQ